MSRWRDRLFEPLDIAPLVFFRICFGALMFWHLLDWFQYGWIHKVYVDAEYHFAYPGFAWLRPWPEDWMVTHFVVITGAAGAMALGWCYRIASVVFFLGYGYVFLLDRSTYNNHYYLIVLLAFWAMVLPAHRAFSLDVRERPELRRDTAPAWTLGALRAQLAVVYVFAALAKMNGDWLLRGEPLGFWLRQATAETGFADLFTADGVGVALSWAGMLFDLMLVPALLWRRTRLAAILGAFVFHFANSLLFHIGVFPVLAFCLTLLFLDPSWARRILRLRPGPNADAEVAAARLSRGRPGLLAGLAVFFAIQALLPLRHWVTPGDVLWDERHGLFSWRMKVSRKHAELDYRVTDSKTGLPLECDWRQWLSEDQRSVLPLDPAMIRQFAQEIGRRLREDGHPDVAVHALSLCGLNGRDLQFLIEPEVDLLAPLPDDWIVPRQPDS